MRARKELFSFIYGRKTMSLKTLMIIKSVVCLLAIPVLFLPIAFYGLFGIQLDANSRYPAWEYGASLVGILLLTWSARNAVDSDARRAICLGLCAYDAVGFVVTVIALLTGEMNFLGWGVAVLYLLLAIGFGYFLLPQKRTA
jgi:hypothetical protein